MIILSGLCLFQFGILSNPEWFSTDDYRIANYERSKILQNEIFLFFLQKMRLLNKYHFHLVHQNLSLSIKILYCI